MTLLENFGAAAFELGAGAVLASLERPKDVFSLRRGQVGAITKMLRRLEHDEVADFATPKGRDDLLWATANYLTPLRHEELIVAVGVRRGRARSAGASYRRIHRTVGTRGRVQPTPKLLRLLEAELEHDGAEVALIHNHPANPIKTVVSKTVGWRPIASTADRQLAAWFLQARLDHLLTARRPSSFKWYLVDDDRVAEFTLPPADVLLTWLSSARGSV